MSCEDNSLIEAASNASRYALQELYFRMRHDNYSNYNKYNPDVDNIFGAYLKSDTSLSNFEFSFENASNIKNELNHLFIYNNDDSNNEFIYPNCAAITASSWFSSKPETNSCIVNPNNIVLPDTLVYHKDTQTITTNFVSKDPSSVYAVDEYREKKAYCENAWYDWLITPNYYLGNGYFKDIGKYTTDDIYKCYKPCDGDSMPYTKNDGSFNCILKKYYENGIFKNKYMFSPIDLINIIGNFAMNKNDGLKNLHKIILKYKISNNVDTTMFNVQTNLKTKLLLNEDYSNIYDQIKKNINNNILKNFSNTSNYYPDSKEFTYLNPIFKETEPELYTLKGLDANNLLIPPILLHTWILANCFVPVQFDNPDFNYKELFSTTSTSTSPDGTYTANLNKLLFTNIYNKLDEPDDNIKKNKAIRLKNIFFKAVNICYDNSTAFSRNIIEKTRSCFTNKDLLESDNDLIKLNYIKYFLFDNFDKLFTDDYLNNYKPPIFINDFNVYYSKVSLDTYISDGAKIREALITPINNIYNPDNISCYFYTKEILESDNQPFDTPSIPIETPKEDKTIDDEINIPNFNNLLLLFLRILIVVVILYIIYIFYDIFGEAISYVINLITINIKEIYTDVLSVGVNNDSSAYLANKLELDIAKKENVLKKVEKIQKYIDNIKDEKD
jgi:hypothetical protein